MKRRADSISDQTVKRTPAITLPPGTPMRLVGDASSSNGTHVLFVQVPADTLIEIGDQT